MAIGMSCIPTVREEIVRLRQAELLAETDARQLELMASDADEPRVQERAGRRIAGTAWTHPRRHWPARLVHTH